MVRRSNTRSRPLPVLALMVLSTGLLVSIGGSSSADVTAVSGSTYGCWSQSSLFGGPPVVEPEGAPLPAVTLPAGGSATPLTATAEECAAVRGPAFLLTTGPLTVSTEGTTGPAGSVTSTASLGPVNTSGQEVFTATSVSSTCGASESATSGSTTIEGGTLVTSEGNPDVEGDETVVTIPTNPPANNTYNGTVESVGDTFRAVFNEQIVDPNTGAITVNAYHLYLLGPSTATRRPRLVVRTLSAKEHP